MNWDQVKGNWRQFTGKALETWGKFADDELGVLHGTHEQQVRKLQEIYRPKPENATQKLDKKLRDLMVARMRQKEEKCFGP